MIGTSSRVALALATAVLALAGPAAPATAATGATAVDPAGVAALDSAVNAYLASYPQMTADQARSAALGQERRKAIAVEIAGRQDDSYGGAWFDPPTGILHLAATKASAVEQAQLLARRDGVKLATHLVARSFTALERQAEALRGGEGVLGQAAGGQVGIDVTTNSVTVALPAKQLSTLTAPEGVTFVADPGQKIRPDAGCTSRDACDQTIRAGAMMWRSDLGVNWCSVGFTARNASNQRILYTAGHCAGGSGVQWATGSEFIGGQAAILNSGAVDAMAINITNSWFTGDTGGEIYTQGGTFSLPVKGAAGSLGFILAGETVCLAANFTIPTGANNCGTVGTTSDATNRGFVRVNGFDACGGDSGGGWYWLPASGNRFAYGIHEGSSTGCHGDAGGSTSWFTAVSSAKAALAPTFNIETR